MTAFDKAWGVVKGLEPVEERTEDKLDQVLEEVRNRPPKEGIELPGLVRTGSLEDQVPDEKIQIPVREFWQGDLLGFDILGLEDWLKANFNGYNEEVSLKDNILAASGPQTLALVMDMLEA